MTKREQHQHINKLFYNYVKQNFPEYTISFDEGGGRGVFILSPNQIKQMTQLNTTNQDTMCVVPIGLVAKPKPIQ